MERSEARLVFGIYNILIKIYMFSYFTIGMIKMMQLYKRTLLKSKLQELGINVGSSCLKVQAPQRERTMFDKDEKNLFKGMNR